MRRSSLFVFLVLSPLFAFPACDTSVDGDLDTGTGGTGGAASPGGTGGTVPDPDVDCSAIEDHANWELCSEDETRCIAVFTDGAGCQELCSSVNLGCSEIWDNIEGECAADTEKPELGCDTLTGHDSDYCVCSGPVTEIPEETTETEGFEDLFTELVGFGENATGGQGGTVCTVTSTADSGSGSLRACIDSANGPLWIRFAVDGEIALSTNISLPSNLTVDGRNRSVELTGSGLRVLNQGNVIITNLSFHSGSGGDDNDAIQVKGGHDIWVHHCSFADYSDGLLDLTKGTKDVTVSWNKFSNHDKVLLISASDNDTQDENTRVTLHHNWFKETKQRHPRIRHGKLHAYNNFIDGWGDYGMGCSTNSECYSERNVFEAATNFKAIVTQVGEDDGQGEVESHGDLMLNGAFAEERGTVFKPGDFYAYSAESTDNLSAAIQAGAGAQ